MIKSFYRFSVALIAIALFATSSYALVPRKVLMEDHTGAWCGWCVLGNQAMEDMLEEYQDMFIPVAVHNGNASSDVLFHPQQAALASAMGVTGYPSGVMNRGLYTLNGSQARTFHPTYWPQLVSEHIGDMSPVDVDVTYNLDKTAMTLTATVKATFSADVAEQLYFNLYVMEDDMAGTDQSNYLTNRAGYENHPYYSLPSKITNYKHKNVLLDMLGGLYGVAGTLPATAKSGQTYEYTFNFNLNNLSVKSQNLDKMWFIGLVEKAQGKYEIMNAKMVGKQLPLPRYKVQATTVDNYLLVTRNNTKKQSVEFSNTSAVDLTVDLAINATKNIPADWTVSLAQSQLVIPANSKKNVDVNIQVGTTAYYGEILVDANVVGTGTYNGGKSQAYLGMLSDGIDYVVYHFNDGALAPIAQSITNVSVLNNKIAYIPLMSSTLTAFSTYDFKLAIIPESFNSRGALINNTQGISFIKNMITNGKPVLLTSILDMFFAAGNTSGVVPDQNTKNFFNTTWGITGPAQSAPLSAGNTSAGTLIQINVNGNTDEISNGWSTTLNQYNSSTFPYYTFWLDNIKILNQNIATPIVLYNIVGITEPTAAVKIQTATNRNIYSGFTFDLIADAAKRTTLLGNMVTWLLGTNGVNFNEPNASKLSVFPNPVVSTSAISFEAPAGISSAEIFVIDINGNKVMNLDTQNLTEGVNTLKINVDGLASGSYNVITNLNGIYSYIPFVIQK